MRERKGPQKWRCYKCNCITDDRVGTEAILDPTAKMQTTVMVCPDCVSKLYELTFVAYNPYRDDKLHYVGSLNFVIETAIRLLTRPSSPLYQWPGAVLIELAI